MSPPVLILTAWVKCAIQRRFGYVWSTLTFDVTTALGVSSKGTRTDSCTAANSIAIQSVRGAGVALLGRLALTVAQNLGIAAERTHDYGRDEFDTR